MSLESILFVPSVRDTQWVPRILTGYSPAELPIAGRRVIDFELEHAVKSGAVLTGILDWHYSSRLAGEFQNPEEKGYSVFYDRWPGNIPRGLGELNGISSPLTGNVAEGLVVVWGLCLSAHVVYVESLQELTPEEVADTPMGVYKFIGGKWMRIRPYGAAIRNVKTWHRANMAVLHAPGIFSLPCYSAEENVHLGRSVVLEQGVEVKPPVLLSDNTWFARNVRLGGDVIVCSGAFIGEGSRLKRTIVGRDTYVGVGLDLENKIVVGRRIIDPESGAWLDMEEPGLSHHIGGGLGWLKALWHFLRGRSYGRLG